MRPRGTSAAIDRADRQMYKTGTRKDIVSRPLPVLRGSMHIKWTRTKGFGVFLGNKGCQIDDTVATYGGVVLTYAEANDRTQCYSLFRLKLKDFPFREDLAALVDGTGVWGGDGKFINQSCCPLVMTGSSLGVFKNTRNVNNQNRSSDLRVLALQLECVICCHMFSCAEIQICLFQVQK